MQADIFKQAKISLLLLTTLTVVTGIIYPMLVTLIAQICFPWQANGSLITVNHKIIGSRLIGQNITDDKYFFGRPSDTIPTPYNALSSAGSNKALSNPAYIKILEDRIKKIHSANPRTNKLIPIELISGSASGLDPEISIAAAHYQAHRIAKLRNIPEKRVHELIEKMIIPPTFNILGDPRVNVLELNMALDKLNDSQGEP
jgi:K+-transporting ATPase ATPase C chain